MLQQILWMLRDLKLKPKIISMKSIVEWLQAFVKRIHDRFYYIIIIINASNNIVNVFLGL